MKIPILSLLVLSSFFNLNAQNGKEIDFTWLDKMITDSMKVYQYPSTSIGININKGIY